MSDSYVTLGEGQRVKYPKPASAAASTVGRANTRADTRPEVVLRSELHRLGLRFRKNHLVRLTTGRVRVDIAFTRVQLAVFVDGCFWHRCPVHGTTPKTNQDYWLPKLEANVRRDQRNNTELKEAGWSVLRFWEHERPDEVAARTSQVYWDLRMHS